MTEDKIVGWYHQLNGHEFEPTLGDSEEQGAWCAAVHEVTKSWTRLSDLPTIDSETSLKVQRLDEVGDTLICALEILEGPWTRY